MTVQRKKYWCTAAGVLAAAGAFPLAVKAAPIVWQSPQVITGDSDVKTTGTLVYSAAFGDSTVTNKTINGVKFAAFDASYSNSPPGPTPTGTVTHGNITVAGIDGQYNGSGPYTGSTSAPFSGLSSSYQGLLAQVVFGRLLAKLQAAPTLR